MHHTKNKPLKLKGKSKCKCILTPNYIYNRKIYNTNAGLMMKNRYFQKIKNIKNWRKKNYICGSINPKIYRN